MSEPRLELVTDFEKLRFMEHVVIRPCAWCEKEHRGRLLKRGYTSGVTATGRLWAGDSWEVVPGLPCQPTSKLQYITAMSVEERRVWRVVEEDDEGVQEVEERERELVTAGSSRK